MAYLTVRELEQAQKHRIRKECIEVTTHGVTQEYRKNQRNLRAVSAHRSNEVLRAFHHQNKLKGAHHG
ncbi:MAG: hypothetical protein U1C51_07315 [Candidatus Izemoplasmatales bacterium]|nr:hypothetical protein [Candidatus Izemoplasmatales bacterium]